MWSLQCHSMYECHVYPQIKRRNKNGIVVYFQNWCQKSFTVLSLLYDSTCCTNGGFMAESLSGVRTTTTQSCFQTTKESSANLSIKCPKCFILLPVISFTVTWTGGKTQTQELLPWYFFCIMKKRIKREWLVHSHTLVKTNGMRDTLNISYATQRWAHLDV